jgi:phosphoglycerol transferase MdoB-like AlkP superfamily enzyme
MLRHAVAAILISWASVGAAEGLRIVEHDVPTSLESGSEVSVTLVAANEGALRWSTADGFAMSYHWLGIDGEVAEWDGRRSAFPAAVDPGSSVELVAKVEAPRRPGRYLLHWDVVQENVRWVSEVDGTGTDPIPVSVHAGHAFSVLDGSAPTIMISGSRTRVELKLQNSGSRAWLPDGSFAVAYHWFDRRPKSVRPKGQRVYWEGRRTWIPVVVRNGDSVVVEAVVEAPAKPGAWYLQWDLVEEGVCWFSERAPGELPEHRVLVIPDPLGSGVWWSLLVLTAGAAAVSVWKVGRPAALAKFFAVGDLAWCVGSVAVKQSFVLSEAGGRPTGWGWLLIVGGVSAFALLALVIARRYSGWACWSLVAAATGVLWADAIYIRFFGDLPSVLAFSAAGQLGQVGASVRELVAPGDIWLWLDLLPGLVLVLVANRLRSDSGPGVRRAVVVVLLSALCAAGVAAIRLSLTQPTLLGQVFRRVAVAEEMGVLNLHAVDAGRSVVRGLFKPQLDPEDFAEVISWFRARAPQRAGTGPSFAAAEGFNLVMVQVESLQTFVIGLEIGEQEVTPFLNRWAEDGIWFSNVTDQTGQGRSSDSELATQTSLLPMAGGAAAFRFSKNDFTGIAEALAERGYETLSAVPYDGAFWNRRQTHPAYGFDRSLFAGDFEEGELVGWGLSDRAFLIQAAAFLADANRPFAAYLLTLSLHHPFEGFPAHLEELDVGEWEGTAFGNFLHTMHFFDASLAAFVTDLEGRGLGDDTIIAVWGDHDAGFDWRPRIAQAMGTSHDPVGWYLSQEVPLLIHAPGADWLRGERTVAAGHLDVAPTLLALLGVDPAPYAFVGRNLLGEHGDLPVVGEYGCWRDANHLFLQGDGSLDDGTCIDMVTLEEVAAAECREGHAAASEIEAMSALVLEHDLQRAINRQLVGDPEVSP